MEGWRAGDQRAGLPIGTRKPNAQIPQAQEAIHASDDSLRGVQPEISKPRGRVPWSYPAGVQVGPVAKCQPNKSRQ